MERNIFIGEIYVPHILTGIDGNVCILRLYIRIVHYLNQ